MRSYYPAELVSQLRNTNWFIDAAPITAVFHRKGWRKNMRGGLDILEDTLLDPQTFRILHSPPRRRRKENIPPDASLGEIPFAKDNLMGQPDMDIAMDDWFEILGEDGETVRYTITYVFIDRTYETIANLATSDQ